MTHTAPSSMVDRTLGVLGLFLMLVIAKLAPRAQSPQRTVAGRVTGFMARRAIDGIAVVGWIVDRLPLPQKDFKHSTRSAFWAAISWRKSAA